MEGPRGVRAEDLESLRTLTGVVMREGLVDQFVQLFNEVNYENLRICSDGGRCVCHVGMIERGAVLFGCQIKVGCIGGVCTLPEYRKQGLASACFDDALRKAYDDGVDLMIVSGDRNLYRMRGCVHVGSDDVFTLTADAPVPAEPDITLERMTAEELPLVTECYRAEPVRFVRPPDDYRFALESGWVMNRPSEFLVIRTCGDFRGYVIAPSVHKDGSASLAELAGDRHAVLAALPLVVKRQGLASLNFQVMRHDRLMRGLCRRAGLPSAPHVTPGTVTLVNFPQIMERVRRRFEEILGHRTTARLRFRQEGDRYLFALGDDELVTDRSDAARVLFGKLDGMPTAVAEREGALAEALRAALPLPTLWYGINYV